MSDAQTLIKIANSLAKLVDDNEKISLPIFTVKLAQAQRQYPEDHTIGMLSTIIAKMANTGNKLFITRAEIKDLYEKFYSRNTKFASVFADEIGVQPVVEQPAQIVQEEPSTDLMQDAVNEIINPVLANALDRAFGGMGKFANYTPVVAGKAIAACVGKINSFGFKCSSQVICGSKDILVCAVECETPRGGTSVLVPVEIINEQILEPNVFVGNNGATDLTKQNIVEYITTQAGNKLNVIANEVLNASISAKGSGDEISNVDLALIKLNSSKEQSIDYLSPQILGVEVEQVNPNLVLDLPKVEDKELETIAEAFDSELGFANFKFGSQTVINGRNTIDTLLKQCGINISSIAVSDVKDNALTYSVSLNGGSVAFKVPVKIEAGKAMPPTVLVCNGSVKAFDKQSVASLLHQEGFDRAAALSASPLYGVKPSDLVKTVKAAMLEGNYAKAEDALNVLSDSEDEKAYNAALSYFTQGLKEKEEQTVEANVSRCSMPLKTASSQHEICGHTGLPVHKVYQDKNGNCLPKYREGMAESYEGATFMNHKVYL